MNSNLDRGGTAALARLAGQGASSAQLAEALLECWQRMHDALAPIIGQRGVAALFSRTLHVTAKDHPWLAPVSPPDVAGAMDLAAFRESLQARHVADTAMAGDAFLHNFTALLSSLVGQSLADHLIGPVRIETSSGDAAQDT